ncbi:hypothetical protein FGO68_gene1906 [Halteria grandinella]|uniref:Uncharacterized protein n=1 Tax=Halteria grandinella TaxID=5974 RepID=A0A8J8NLC7_HALGN|nr:hypothetical protein FGO68_gene1906 [Halteria grandinella]
MIIGYACLIAVSTMKTCRQFVDCKFIPWSLNSNFGNRINLPNLILNSGPILFYPLWNFSMDVIFMHIRQQQGLIDCSHCFHRLCNDILLTFDIFLKLNRLFEYCAIPTQQTSLYCCRYILYNKQCLLERV